MVNAATERNFTVSTPGRVHESREEKNVCRMRVPEARKRSEELTRRDTEPCSRQLNVHIR